MICINDSVNSVTKRGLRPVSRARPLRTKSLRAWLLPKAFSCFRHLTTDRQSRLFYPLFFFFFLSFTYFNAGINNNTKNPPPFHSHATVKIPNARCRTRRCYVTRTRAFYTERTKERLCSITIPATTVPASSASGADEKSGGLGRGAVENVQRPPHIKLSIAQLFIYAYSP